MRTSLKCLEMPPANHHAEQGLRKIEASEKKRIASMVSKSDFLKHGKPIMDLAASP